MGILKYFQSLIGGHPETVDTSVNTLVVDTITVGGDSGTDLDKTTLDSLIASSGSSQQVDQFVLSNTDETNKFVTLSGTPAVPANTILLVEGAPDMYYGDDFTVTGNQLSWSGKTLDGILAQNDKITVTYGI